MTELGYVVARNILLDALEALAPYGRGAIVIVGAQAVYLRCQNVQAPIAPFTLDSDIVLDLEHRESSEPIRERLEREGYSLRNDQPGLYRAPNLPEEPKHLEESTCSCPRRLPAGSIGAMPTFREILARRDDSAG